ncbi:ISAs1 family transposase [Massilia glaciei]|uniref:ISAs1 family transposase n=1 Tax=Massilia glaciei TaxID=1524097 RepID=UPI0022773E79|nr:ISAs1 family transposase [Massilia glaciei]
MARSTRSELGRATEPDNDRFDEGNHRREWRRGTASVERRFYISSLPARAARLAQPVRAHWGIGNGMHWVLDVAFREDDCRIRVGEAAQNFAILRRIALNLSKKEKTTELGVGSKRLKAGWNCDYLSKVLG